MALKPVRYRLQVKLDLVVSFVAGTAHFVPTCLTIRRPHKTRYLTSHRFRSRFIIPTVGQNTRGLLISPTNAIGIVRMPQRSSNAAGSLLQPRTVRRTPPRPHPTMLAKRRWKGNDAHRPGFETRSRPHVRDFCTFSERLRVCFAICIPRLSGGAVVTCAPSAGCASLPEMAGVVAGS